MDLVDDHLDLPLFNVISGDASILSMRSVGQHWFISFQKRDSMLIYISTLNTSVKPRVKKPRNGHTIALVLYMFPNCNTSVNIERPCDYCVTLLWSHKESQHCQGSWD